MTSGVKPWLPCVRPPQKKLDSSSRISLSHCFWPLPAMALKSISHRTSATMGKTSHFLKSLWHRRKSSHNNSGLVNGTTADESI